MSVALGIRRRSGDFGDNERPKQNFEGTWQAPKTPDSEPEAEQQWHQVILIEGIVESLGRKIMQWEVW